LQTVHQQILFGWRCTFWVEFATATTKSNASADQLLEIFGDTIVFFVYLIDIPLVTLYPVLFVFLILLESIRGVRFFVVIKPQNVVLIEELGLIVRGSLSVSLILGVANLASLGIELHAPFLFSIYN
jgi:hypothetical protein